MAKKSTAKKSTKSTTRRIYNSDLLKIGQAAKLLGKPVSTIRDWCNQGLLKPVVFESGHRLFNIAEVIAMKTNNIDNTEINYVEKAKQMREQRKEKFACLKSELEKFNGTGAGVKLEVEEKIFLNTDDDTTLPWIVVRYEDDIIFAANYFEGEVYDFKKFQYFRPETKTYFGLDALCANIVKETRTLVAAKISNISKGTLTDLLDSLSRQIATL